jgi:uroporphyrinogen decarboxylase
MDTARLKATYGKDVVFWGGGVDTQHVLPFGTPEEVRAEVHKRVTELGPDGFVWAFVHNIQAGVPAENILAAVEALRDAGAA